MLVNIVQDMVLMSQNLAFARQFFTLLPWRAKLIGTPIFVALRVYVMSDKSIMAFCIPILTFAVIVAEDIVSWCSRSRSTKLTRVISSVFLHKDKPYICSKPRVVLHR